MANIPEPVPEFREVYEWTTKDRAKAGPTGVMIVPLQDLMARDGYLKVQIEAQNGTISGLATRADENEAAIEQTNAEVASLDAAYREADTGLQTQVDDLVAGQSTSAIYANTLTDLQAVTGSFVGQGGFVANGTGTGQYRWSGSVWDFLRADVLSQKADISQVLPIAQEVVQKADRSPLVDRLFTSSASDVAIFGVTNVNGDVQAVISFDPNTGATKSRGQPLLTPATARDYLPGMYIGDADDVQPIWGITDAMGNPQAVLAYKVSQQQLLINGVAMGAQDRYVPSADASATVSGSTVSVRGVLHKSSGDVSFTEDLEILSPAGITVSGSAYSLITNSESRWYANPNAKLPYRFVSGVSVTLDGSPLVEGVDFAVWYAGGKLRGVSGSGTREVLVSYTGLPQRYDLIVADAVSGALSVVQGVARNVDPEEYRPVSPVGTVPLFYVLSHGGEIQVIPLARWSGTEKAGRDTRQLDAHNRRVLAPIRAALFGGRDITVIGYGDSITALAGLADHTVPNGPTRDLRSFFNQIPADTYATIPALDFGDGSGAIHTDLGWNRQLRAWLERVYGGAVTYLNYGIGGSSSGTGSNGDRLNGLNPTRLQYVLDSITAATTPVLVNLSFGMNELGSTSTLDNIVQLVQQMKAAGATVQVIGVSRPGGYGGFGSVDAWRYTNDMLYAAAMSAGAAFVPLAAYFDDDQLGYAGLAPDSLSGNANVNHPGITEYRSLAEIIIRNFEA